MNYLVMLNLAAKDKTNATKIINNLSSACTKEPKNVWIDPAYAAYAIESDKTAAQIWQTINGGNFLMAGIKDMLIIELARDWCGRNESPGHGWFNSHLGAPLVSRALKG